jgi:hypothetical protein
VGKISSNGDAEIGRFIADAMKKVGNEGVTTEACWGYAAFFLAAGSSMMPMTSDSFMNGSRG